MPHFRWFSRTNPLDANAADPEQDFNISGPKHFLGTYIDWNNEHHRRIIMSSLVNAVYTLKSDRLKNRQGGNALAPPWWENFHFEITKELIDPKKNTIFGAIFKFKFPNHDDMTTTIRPPKYVIAFRGTSLEPDSINKDMQNNFRLIISRLHRGHRLLIAMKAAENLIEQNGGCADTIWLAGHSLGAAIALSVGRDLVLQKGDHLPTYLYNPPCPHITAAILAKSDVIKRLVLCNRSIFIAFVANTLGLRKDDKDFILLSKWVPNIFVNPRDLICKEYVEYFLHRERMESAGLENIERLSTQHSIATLIKGAKTSHLLPVAYLTINNEKSQDAHAIRQWRVVHAIRQWWVPQDAFIGEYRIDDKFWELKVNMEEDGNGESSNAA